MIIKTTLEKFPIEVSKVYRLHFPIPKAIAEHFIDGDNRRVKCSINGEVVVRSGLMPYQDYWYILCNQSKQKQLNLMVGQAIELELEKDASKYGMEMPEELEVMLDQEPEAFEFFEQLTPGKQRNLIYLVSKVKNTNSRINKALAIAAHLKEGKGQLDFKKLNELIKYYNNLDRA
ncbi:MAG: YdeI/OmpD-associated family protein [Cyclobacteriaceae bacterium]